MKDEGYFGKVCSCRLISMLTFSFLHGHEIPVERGFTALLLSQEISAWLDKGNSKKASFCMFVLNGLQFKIIHTIM
jgi:hypothetical protein